MSGKSFSNVESGALQHGLRVLYEETNDLVFRLLRAISVESRNIDSLAE